ncbi:MAG: patatin-like phospholipase family protein [Gammaproteobacteria bacterium]|nr:patatin-like phospholipase family protein [Gammaproteobacteria bacterium]
MNLTRRRFLELTAAAALSGLSCTRPHEAKRIGLALGAGGARGLAHVPIVELFDELRIRPDLLAGSSMGAVVGVLYASGMSGATIRDLIDDLVVRETESLAGALSRWEVFKWLGFLDPDFGNGGLLSTEKFVLFIQEAINRTTFEELDIPLKIVAADFWNREPVVFDRGELLPALQASIAIPGLFTPIIHQGRTLVDGSAANPVPYDLLHGECDITIAVDVQGRWTPSRDLAPSLFDTAMGASLIMQKSIIREQLKVRPPTIYLSPELHDIRVLDFDKADTIYGQTLASKERLRKQLMRLL